MTACQSCGAEILWAVSATTGKRMPVDAAPTPTGNVDLTRNTHGELLATVRPQGGHTMFDPPDLELHLSHFVTCPDAATWRT